MPEEIVKILETLDKLQIGKVARWQGTHPGTTEAEKRS